MPEVNFSLGPASSPAEESLLKDLAELLEKRLSANEIISILRRRYGLLQVELAVKAAISPYILNRMERGNRPIDEETLRRLVAYLKSEVAARAGDPGDHRD